uniref:Putative RNA-directed DNA polymerase from transposon BS n=1 Tax=Bactrocera latifrons TaxID=174628 RepID=A0A0K8WFX9_BACLA
MIRLDHYPSQWKCAEIIMIPKPNKPENCASAYHPISLLVTFSKIFGKISLKRMLPVLEVQNILPEHEFEFKRGHGTPELCHRIVKIITSAFECKQYCAGVFLDVKKAFDKVWHPVLLYKIKKWFPAPYYRLIKSFLSSLTFYVKEKDAFSELYSNGAVLYTIFTADLPIANGLEVETYADDTAFIATSFNPSDASLHLQEQLNIVEKWLKNWKIEVNTQKSVQITFTLRTEKCPPNVKWLHNT